jgi:hypothetical protein
MMKFAGFRILYHFANYRFGHKTAFLILERNIR